MGMFRRGLDDGRAPTYRPGDRLAEIARRREAGDDTPTIQYEVVQDYGPPAPRPKRGPCPTCDRGMDWIAPANICWLCQREADA